MRFVGLQPDSFGSNFFLASSISDFCCTPKKQCNGFSVYSRGLRLEHSFFFRITSHLSMFLLVFHLQNI